MTTRRGFLGGMAGILAAGFAPAAIGSNVLMPVRRIALPPMGIAIDREFLISPVEVPLMFQQGRVWQDLAGTIPVTGPGQPVARVDHMVRMSGGWMSAIQPTAARRPTYQVDERGAPYLQYDGKDDYLYSIGRGMA